MEPVVLQTASRLKLGYWHGGEDRPVHDGIIKAQFRSAQYRDSSTGFMDSSSSSVRVFCRFRPTRPNHESVKNEVILSESTNSVILGQRANSRPMSQVVESSILTLFFLKLRRNKTYLKKLAIR